MAPIDNDEQADHRRVPRSLVLAGSGLGIAAATFLLVVLVSGSLTRTPLTSEVSSSSMTSASPAPVAAAPTRTVTPFPTSSVAQSTIPQATAPEDCFGIDDSSAPGPYPSSSPPDNAAFQARLPAAVFGAPTIVETATGAWATNGGFGSQARGLLACAGAAPDDLWMGWVTSSGTLGFAVLAFQIDGVSGEDLERIWIDDFLKVVAARVPGTNLTVTNAEYSGRHYLQVGSDRDSGYAVAYAAGSTFYWISEYCCVEMGSSGTEYPTTDEIQHAWLEALPLS